MPSMEPIVTHNHRAPRAKKPRKFFDSADYYSVTASGKAAYTYVPHPVVFKGAPTAPSAEMSTPAANTCATTTTTAAAPLNDDISNTAALAVPVPTPTHTVATAHRALPKRSARKFFDSADYYSVSVTGKAAYTYVPHPVVFKDVSAATSATTAAAASATTFVPASVATTVSSENSALAANAIATNEPAVAAAASLLLPLDDDDDDDVEAEQHTRTASTPAAAPTAGFVARQALQRRLKGRRIHFDSAEWALGLTNTTNNNGC